MVRWITPIVVMALGALGIVAPTALAAKPAVETVDATANAADVGLCAFPVSIDVHWLGTQTTYVDRSGAPIRQILHLSETDVFTAHGKQLVGHENSTQVITFVQGVPTFLTNHGQLFTHVQLPGGGVFLGMTGRVVLDATGAIVSFHGMPATTPPARSDRFCAALE